MKRPLFHALGAAMLAVVVMISGNVRPAKAIEPATVVKIIQVAKAAYDVIRSAIGGGTSIDDAVDQIVAEIEQAKGEILTHIDAIATANARACARHHVIEFHDIDLFNPTVLQSWAQDATGCVTLIDSLLDTVGDKGQIDLLGAALNVAGPIALAARAKAGFGTSLLTQTLREGNSTLANRLFPTCHSWSISEAPGMLEVFYECTAYTGQRAMDSEFWRNGKRLTAPINEVALQNQATSGTTRAVALAVLPSLQF